MNEQAAEVQRLDTMRLDLKDARYTTVQAELNGKSDTLAVPEPFGLLLAKKEIPQVQLHQLTTDRQITLSPDKQEVIIGGRSFPSEKIVKALGAGTEVEALNRWRRKELIGDKEIAMYYVPFLDETANQTTVVRLSLEDYGRLRDVLFGARPDKQKQPVRIASARSVARSEIETPKGEKKEIQSLQAANLTTSGPLEYRFRVEHASSIGDRMIDEDYVGDVSFLIQGDPKRERLLFVGLADGAGGHAAGDEASERAWQAVKESLIGTQGEKKQRRLLYDPKEKVYKFWNSQAQRYDVLGSDLTGEAGENLARSAVREANNAVFEWTKEQENDALTTFVGCLIIGDTAFIPNVGDSRAYIQGAKDRKLYQLTEDHSLMASLLKAGMLESEEVAGHPQRNVIYRAVGDKPSVEIDVVTRSLIPGASIVLTCDGNPGAFQEEYSSPQKMSAAVAKGAKELVKEAIQSPDCEDNCSAVKITLNEVLLRKYQFPEEALANLSGIVEGLKPESLEEATSIKLPAFRYGIKQLIEMKNAGKIPEDDLPKFAQALGDFNTFLKSLI